MGIQDSFDDNHNLTQSSKKQWNEDLILSLIVRMGVEPVTVEACEQKDGTRLWGIFQACNVMSKEDGLWYYNRRSSSRPENYQELFRWDSAQEAFEFAVKMLERNDAIALQERNQNVD